MDPARLIQHKLDNWLRTLALLAGMILLLSWVGSWLFPGAGLWLALALSAAFLLFSPKIPTAWMLRRFRARPLRAREAPHVFELSAELARRAGLARAPSLHYVPSSTLNAFALGRRDDPAVVLTDGILRHLSPRELAGILAHEISHIRNRDLGVLTLADGIGRLTRSLSLLAQVLILLNLFDLLGSGGLPLLPLLLLAMAPALSGLLQLALVRTRELGADLEAARLTRDPGGLASALRKLELRQRHWLSWLLPIRPPEAPGMLRTHPPTRERIARLLALRPDSGLGSSWA